MSWTLHAIGEFDRLQPDWERLNRASGASPLLATDFVVPLVREFAGAGEILACRHRDGQLCAMVILTPQGRGRWQTFQPSQAPLGICVHDGLPDWQAGLARLLLKLPGMALTLGVTQQDPALQARPANGATLATLDYIRTASITLGGTFAQYWNARGKNLRQNMKKQRARLEKEAIVTRLEISTEPAQMALAVADYGRLESAGWKGERGTAIHPDNPQGRFYRSMLERFCSNGRGRVFRYWYDDRLVAMDLCIEGDDHIVILKTTYDESIGNTTSPALLMRQEAFALLFGEPRLKRIEFFGKLMEWHARWSEETRTMYHFTLYRWSALLLFRKLLRHRVNQPTD